MTPGAVFVAFGGFVLPEVGVAATSGATDGASVGSAHATAAGAFRLDEPLRCGAFEFEQAFGVCVVTVGVAVGVAVSLLIATATEGSGVASGDGSDVADG